MKLGQRIISLASQLSRAMPCSQRSAAQSHSRVTALPELT
jgi:hypothetical protein